MGSICSKNNYTNISTSKSKRKTNNKVADLDDTMKDDIHEHRSHQHLSKKESERSENVESSQKKTNRKSFVSSNGTDGIAGLTSTTLDNDCTLKDKVKLPPNVQLEKWIYINLMEFVETTRMLYDSVSHLCTDETCPEMTAGPHYSYVWTDFNGSNVIPMGAYQYIMTLFDAIDDLFHSPPYDQCKNDVFPDDFMQISRAIYKKLFRVYAHVYHHHLNEFTKIGAEAHLNTTFKLFVLFEREYKMINMKEELPLRKLIQRLIEEDQEDDSIEDPRSIYSRGTASSSYRKESHSDGSE